MMTSEMQAQFGDSLKSPTTTSLTASDALLAASSIDISARIIGVKHIIQSLPSSAPAESGTVVTEHLDLLIGLITNLSEDQSVVSAVYETSPGPLASNLMSDAGRFIAGVVDVLSRNVLLKAERPLLRLHLNFFANVILTHSMTDAIVVRAVVEKLFLPVLLFSKPKQKRASLAWEIISSSPEAFDKADVLKGCAEIVKIGLQNAKNKLTSEEMVEVNDKIINQITGAYEFLAVH
jgi:U3 small nucleolar RNA-associated protein 10